MQEYLNLLKDVLEHGTRKADRTGTGTVSAFGRMMRFDLAQGFPLLTTKKVHFKSIAHELLWFLQGTDDTSYLEKNGVSIWREWQTELSRENGEKYWSIGPLYGVNWLRYKDQNGQEINQIQNVIDQIKSHPDSRRLVVSAWNPATLPDLTLTPQQNVLAGKGCLAPCHAFFQFSVNDGKLSCILTQRNADLFLGVPFNIASYSLLTMMVAQQTGLQPGEFIWTGGDVHIYLNHMEQVELQLSRQPLTSPLLRIKRQPRSIFDYSFEDFEILNYQPHPAIKAPISV